MENSIMGLDPPSPPVYGKKKIFWNNTIFWELFVPILEFFEFFFWTLPLINKFYQPFLADMHTNANSI